ncbi:Noc2p family-domain-containing protein [Paraphysoderma sedebokerense]|nr:Noc2p family-domain-containing protein [Paraphysoderma sedebokerense]KAI9140783.1 Noc2p family-domain-containing protein [Paraphysoderma sedebokerense]
MTLDDLLDGGSDLDVSSGEASEGEGNDDSEDELEKSDQENIENLDGGNDESSEEGSGSEDEEDLSLHEAASKHKAQLDKLKEKDPEFYQYLLENDQELLDFDDADFEEDQATEQADTTMEEDHSQKDEDGEKLTKEMLQEWETDLKKTQSLKTLKELLLAFKSAIAQSTAADKKNGTEQTILYRVDEATLYKKLIITTVKCVPEVVEFYMKRSQGSKVPRRLGNILKSFFASVTTLLSTTTDPNMLQYILQESKKLVKYITTFPKIIKSFIKVLLSIFRPSSSTNSILSSFAVLYTLAADVSVLPVLLKGTYLSYVRASKVHTIRTVENLNLMRRLTVKLWGIDTLVSYEWAFVYIRQLGILLRGSVVNKTKDSVKQIYNWPFIHSLKFWSECLATYCNKSVIIDNQSTKGKELLLTLVYPLLQIMSGVVRLNPHSHIFPLHLHVLSSIVTLTSATHTYLPLPALVLPLFAHQKSKPSTLKPLDLNLYLKCPKQYERTRIYVEAVTEKSIELLAKWCAAQSNSIGFPELSVPIINSLRTVVKHMKTGPTPISNGKKKKGKTGGVASLKSIQFLKSLIDKLSENSKYIIKLRSDIDHAPGEIEKVENAWIALVSGKDTPLEKFWKGIENANQAQEKMKKRIEDDEQEEEVSDNGEDDAAEDSDVEADEDAMELDVDGQVIEKKGAKPEVNGKIEKKKKKKMVKMEDDDDDDEFFKELAMLDTVHEVGGLSDEE